MNHQTQRNRPERPDKHQKLLDAVRKLAARVGPNLTLAQFSRLSGRPTSQVYRWFGSWGAVRIAAGLPQRVNLRECLASYTRDEVLEAMQQSVETEGASLSQATFCQRTGISPGPIKRIFGSWGELRRAVGLDPQTPTTSRPRFTHDELIAQLKQTVAQNGDVTLFQFCQTLGASRQVIYRHSSWTDLREAADLPRASDAGAPQWLLDLVSAIPDPADYVL